MVISDDRAVIEATVKLIVQAREVVPEYASGSTSCEISRLFVKTRTQLVETQFESLAKGMAFPDGDAVILLDTSCMRSDRMFTIRHEFAHILGGEVEEALLLTSDDTMAFPERRADLFAVADLVPTWLIRQCKGTRRPWRRVTLEVVQAFRDLTEGWSEQRLWDRAKLRVMLYREHGI